MMRNKDIIELWQNEYDDAIPDNRNILKFDFSADLPNIFKEYKLQIMPIGEKKYRIAPIQMYMKLRNQAVPVIPITSPIKIASLDLNGVTTESNAQTVAEISGMFLYIFHDLNVLNKQVVSTLSGKNNVGNVEFFVDNYQGKGSTLFDINTWQAEIDGVYESEKTILIVESKMKFPEDFNIRQLFIPRLLVEKTMDKLKEHKEAYAAYFVKTKDVYIFTVYNFTDLKNLNSIKLKKQYKFTLSDDPKYIFSTSAVEAPEDSKRRDQIRTVNWIINDTKWM